MRLLAPLLGLSLLVAGTTARADRRRVVDLGPGYQGWTLELIPGAERAGTAIHRVRVLDAAGRTRQLLRYRSEVTSPALLEAQVLVEDLDFDGYLDLGLLREFGAKWDAHRIWRFDPRRGRFVESPLARALGRLINLEVDHARRELVAHSVGPCDPWRRRYRLVGGRLRLVSEDRPIPAGTCLSPPTTRPRGQPAP